MTATLPNCFAALTARGFTLSPWRHQEFVRRMFGESGETRVFHRGTLNGLIEYHPGENELRVIALYNNERGNGHFVAAVAELEAIARAPDAPRLLVVQFENERLAAWFGRRPGWLRWQSATHGEFAEFVP